MLTTTPSKPFLYMPRKHHSINANNINSKHLKLAYSFFNPSLHPLCVYAQRTQLSIILKRKKIFFVLKKIIRAESKQQDVNIFV